jgi:methylamine dehydrogenase accessory protein MauD
MSPAWQAMVVALWLVALIQVGLVLALYRQVGIVYLGSRSARERDGLELFLEAPDWEADDHQGRRVRSNDLRGRPLVLAFADPNCGPCQQLMPELKAFSDRYREQISIVVVGSADDRANRQMADRYLLDFSIVSQAGRRLTNVFNVVATPFVYFIDSKGVIRDKGIVNGQEQLEAKLQVLKEAGDVGGLGDASGGDPGQGGGPEEVRTARAGMVVHDGRGADGGRGVR